MPPRLLVADDDRALLELMSMTLRKEGCQVVTASSAAEVRDTLIEVCGQGAFRSAG